MASSRRCTNNPELGFIFASLARKISRSRSLLRCGIELLCLCLIVQHELCFRKSWKQEGQDSCQESGSCVKRLESKYVKSSTWRIDETLCNKLELFCFFHFYSKFAIKIEKEIWWNLQDSKKHPSSPPGDWHLSCRAGKRWGEEKMRIVFVACRCWMIMWAGEVFSRNTCFGYGVFHPTMCGSVWRGRKFCKACNRFEKVEVVWVHLYIFLQMYQLDSVVIWMYLVTWCRRYMRPMLAPLMW